MSETTEQNWKRLFEQEGVSPSDLAKMLDVPPARVSEWLSRKRICTATVFLRLWVEKGEKKCSFQLVETDTNYCINDGDEIFGRENVRYYVAKGLYGLLNLHFAKTAYFAK